MFLCMVPVRLRRRVSPKCTTIGFGGGGKAANAAKAAAKDDLNSKGISKVGGGKGAEADAAKGKTGAEKAGDARKGGDKDGKTCAAKTGDAKKGIDKDGFQMVDNRRKGPGVWELRADDWDAPIYDVDELAEKLDAQLEADLPVRAVLLAGDEEEAQQIFAMGRCSGSIAISIVLRDKEHGTRKIPFGEKDKPGTTPHIFSCQSWDCQAGDPRLPKLKNICATTAKVGLQKDNTVVVRLTTPKDAVDSDAFWKKCTEKPKSALFDWVTATFPVDIARGLLDCWEFKQEKIDVHLQMSCKARIKATSKDQMILLSGSMGVSVNPLRSGDPNWPQMSLVWQPRCPGKPLSELIKTALKEKPEYGLTFSRGQIALRKKVTGDELRRRHFQIDDVPMT